MYLGQDKEERDGSKKCSRQAEETLNATEKKKQGNKKTHLLNLLAKRLRK